MAFDLWSLQLKLQQISDRIPHELQVTCQNTSTVEHESTILTHQLLGWENGLSGTLKVS